MRKIKSGIYGLNPLLDGGINENSTTVVIGRAGAGKTTFALQFLMRGLEMGEEGVFISLDENKDQIIKEAIELGFDKITEYVDMERVVFIDASGKQFTNFILKELPDIAVEWHGTKSRIVIDPLTPVIWAINERYEQRELLAFLFKVLRNIGTVVATLEEHGPTADLSGPETVIPMYLADSVIHLQYRYVENGGVVRNFRVVKCRHSKHSEVAHPYRIIGGLGIVVWGTSTTNQRVSRNAPERIKNVVLARASKLPSDVRSRILRACDKLSDADFQNVNLTSLINDIIREYYEEEVITASPTPTVTVGKKPVMSTTTATTTRRVTVVRKKVAGGGSGTRRVRK